MGAQGRVVLCCDLDYFYAQCEERENPTLKGKPIVVCVYSGRSEDSGAVSTTSYAARSLGVKAGMPIIQAKRTLKDKGGVFLPANWALYETTSERIMAILRPYADRFEQGGIDEAYLEVTQRTGGDFEEAKRLAGEIKERILAGERLTCTVGVGPNKLIAKMASDHQKPDGLTVVKPGEVAGFLNPLPVGKLFGVGRKTEEKLAELGVKTVGDLAAYSPDRLIGLFGKKFGLYLHQAAQGIDETPLEEGREIEQISRMVTLKEDTREIEAVSPVLDVLCGDIHSHLAGQSLTFKSVGILAVMEDLSTHSKTRTLDAATDSLNTLKKVSKELLPLLLSSNPELKIRRIGVRVSGLVELKGQKTLTDF